MFVSALFFSPGYVASLCLAGAVISCFHTLFLPPSNYLQFAVVNKPLGS